MKTSHPDRHRTVRIARLGASFAAALATAGVLGGAAAAGDGAGVTDFSGANPEAIRQDDIASALAVPRGTRIEAAAPPTLRLPVFFEFDSADLRPEARELLDKVGAALASDALATFQFSIEGHTDALGSEPYNASLSKARADSVKSYLVARGVPPERLATVGRGEDSPIAENADEQGRQRNRRVEMINLGSGN